MSLKKKNHSNRIQAVMTNAPHVWSSLVHWPKSLRSKSPFFHGCNPAAWLLGSQSPYQPQQIPLVGGVTANNGETIENIRKPRNKALQTDPICADLCWHQITSKSANLQRKHPRNNNETTEHNNATQPFLGVCSSFECAAICKGTVTLFRITTSKVSPVTT